MSIDTFTTVSPAATSQIDCDVLHSLGEHLAAGYFELPTATPLRKLARGLRRHFEQSPLPGWHAEPLYPCGATALPVTDTGICFSYTAGLVVNAPALQKQLARHPNQAPVLQAAAHVVDQIYHVGSAIPAEYSLGGGGYTHSIIHYERLLHEGLAEYMARLQRYASETSDPAKLDFYAAMHDVLEGLATLTQRIQQQIARAAGDSATGLRLLVALQRVPMYPARDAYEAIVATNLLWYIDGCDNLGRFDQYIAPYVDASSSRAELLELVRLMWRNINANSGWNVAIGGSDSRGQAAYNLVTALCLEAAVSSRRPNLALRVRPDMPAEIWERALDTIASGCGLPALYNEEGYLRSLPNTYGEMGGDLYQYAFGGCTETMVQGRSNVGSIDGGINLLDVLDKSIQAHLAGAKSFDEFLSAFLAETRQTIREVTECVNHDQQMKARQQPQPLRSLFIDDCLERGLEYNAGGARYNTGVINVGGLANVADALVALRELVFSGRINRQRMLAAMHTNYAHDKELLHILKACPKFGNDDDRVDALASQVANETFAAIRSQRAWRSNTPFEPACILFVTYAGAGQSVGATPDGRQRSDPIADSVGPMQGRDTHGPTAMLRSVCKLPLDLAVGTPILNIRLAKELFTTVEGRQKVIALFRAYFAMGGMQIQATVVDQAILRDAIAHPENHAGLIVRIGGYSEYFNNLTPELKQSVLERTEHQ
jgi:formate C-acetyltransferase